MLSRSPDSIDTLHLPMWSRSPDSIDILYDRDLVSIFSFLDPSQVILLKRVSFRWLHLARRTLTRDPAFAAVKAVAEAEPIKHPDATRQPPEGLCLVTPMERKLPANQYAPIPSSLS